ncbi:hypothetical protein [Brevundimonas sp. R86498]|uniref:hypothetical protein n=1 Tax=Brevundimonas sp. R86498 TaxID=3093845 RepID=UPI0037CC2215
MLAFGLDVRELDNGEIDNVHGGAIWLAAIPIGLGIAAAAASYKQRRRELAALAAAEKGGAQ